MIFQQYIDLLSGKKTETRRLKHPKYLEIGKTRAVVPKRGQPAWWYGYDWLNNRYFWIEQPVVYVSHLKLSHYEHSEATKYLADQGFVQARIIIKDIYPQRLQDITHEAALREGVATIHQYATLWNSINDKPGFRWADNPLVEVIRFCRTDELLDLMQIANT